MSPFLQRYLGDLSMDEAVVEVELPSGYAACKEGRENCVKEVDFLFLPTAFCIT